ncbi:MAG: DUF192 domain-containing protein [Acidimicrobiia bacterium]|nr:DUF192 domain-containing protein [Acidimicrobiia bacterium]
MKSRLLLVAAVAVLVTACSDAGGEVTPTTPASATTAASTTTTTAAPTTTPTTSTTPTTTPPDPQVPEQLTGLETTSVSLDDRQLLVAVADTPALRRTGLMFVEDLGDLDGMLFVFEADTSGGFWMKNTLLPLDIAFFDVQGGFVDGFVMEPCKADPCPTYVPSGSYRYALEMEAGTMPADPQTLTLQLGAGATEES